MGIPVMVLGESGTGKTTSLRNFKPDEIGVINVSGKRMPFKSGIKTYISDDYMKIENVIKNSKCHTIVIDDSQYLMANEFMRTAQQSGYQKFTNMALNFWTLIQMIIKETPDNKIVYFLHHIETTDNGKQKIKTVGKLLDEKITLEGLFTIVLKTSVHDGRYFFMTQNSGNDTVKSPIGLFSEPEIENDLKAVDTAVRKYYEIEV